LYSIESKSLNSAFAAAASAAGFAHSTLSSNLATGSQILLLLRPLLPPSSLMQSAAADGFFGCRSGLTDVRADWGLD
jgi:hypothetical protein